MQHNVRAVLTRAGGAALSRARAAMPQLQQQVHETPPMSLYTRK